MSGVSPYFGAFLLSNDFVDSWMLRADKPENPRRLNSAPQKRGTKSSTDLAS